MRPVLILLAATLAGAPALAATTKLQTAMTGAAEVPGPGSDKAKGDAALTFDTDKNQVCYTLHASGADTPTMAHIHKGATGVAGPPVVTLAAPATGQSEGCAPVAADALAAILASPSDYYVNVHTAAFPKGAIRGQLK